MNTACTSSILSLDLLRRLHSLCLKFLGERCCKRKYSQPNKGKCENRTAVSALTGGVGVQHCCCGRKGLGSVEKTAVIPAPGPGPHHGCLSRSPANAEHDHRPALLGGAQELTRAPSSRSPPLPQAERGGTSRRIPRAGGGAAEVSRDFVLPRAAGGGRGARDALGEGAGRRPGCRRCYAGPRWRGETVGCGGPGPP
jgi:hypothetical protein